MEGTQPQGINDTTQPLRAPEGLLRSTVGGPQPSPSNPVQKTASVILPPSSIKPSGKKRSFTKLIIGIVVVLLITVVALFFLFFRQSQEKVTLTWWGLWEDKATVSGVITEFEKEHPNINITYSRQDPNQYRERLTTRIGLGTGPDIFLFHNTWYPMLSKDLLPLSTDVMTPEEFQKVYYPVMQKDLMHNGAIYGIPFGSDTLSLFINTDLFKATGLNPPTNWDEFVDDARALTVKNGDGKIRTSGAAFGTMNNITHAPDIISMLMAQQGVTMDNIVTTKQEQTDALTFYTSFAHGSQNTWDNTLDDSLLAFSKGDLAMYFGYSWDVFEIQQLNKNLSFTVHPVPQLVDKKTTIASYWANGISSQSKQKDAALLFLGYLAKKETQQKLYNEEAKVRGFGAPYARIDLATTLKDNALVFPFVDQLANTQSSYFASDTHDGEGGLNSSLNVYLTNAVNSISGFTSVQSAVETLDEGVAQVFSKYGIQ